MSEPVITPHEPAYRVCGECFHVFRTAQALIDAYNAMLREVAPQLAPVVIAAGIYACPLCSHDF